MCFLEKPATEQTLFEPDEPDSLTEKPWRLALNLRNFLAVFHFMGPKSGEMTDILFADHIVAIAQGK